MHTGEKSNQCDVTSEKVGWSGLNNQLGRLLPKGQQTTQGEGKIQRKLRRKTKKSKRNTINLDKSYKHPKTLVVWIISSADCYLRGSGPHRGRGWDFICQERSWIKAQMFWDEGLGYCSIFIFILISFTISHGTLEVLLFPHLLYLMVLLMLMMIWRYADTAVHWDNAGGAALLTQLCHQQWCQHHINASNFAVHGDIAVLYSVLTCVMTVLKILIMWLLMKEDSKNTLQMIHRHFK